MPNGGSDCCGTCCFNSRNKGESGYAHATDPGEDRCMIRDLHIQNSFYTYCANHPHHNPKKTQTPVGPVYIGDGDRRIELAKSADTPEIRSELVKLLGVIPEKPSVEYPFGQYFDEQVIRQLGTFREPEAINGLRRIIGFDPLITSDSPVGRDRTVTICCAIEALALICGDEALGDIQKLLGTGLEKTSVLSRFLRGGRSRGWDKYAAVRYCAANALLYCSLEGRKALLTRLGRDPDPKVARLVKAMIKQT